MTTSRRPTGKPLTIRVEGEVLPVADLVEVYKAATKPGAVKALELAKACLEREGEPVYYDLKVVVTDPSNSDKTLLEETKQLELFPEDGLADKTRQIDGGHKQELEDLYLLLRSKVEGY